MKERSDPPTFADRARARHRMAADLHTRVDLDLPVYEDIKDLTIKAQIQMAQIKSLLQAIRLPVKI